MLENLIKDYIKEEEELVREMKKNKKKEENKRRVYKEIIEEGNGSKEDYRRLMKLIEELKEERHIISNKKIKTIKKRNEILKLLGMGIYKEGERKERKRKNKSLGEEKVECILKKLIMENEIEYYEYEKKLDVKRKRNLRADFFIKKGKSRYIIEVDGEQHYKGIYNTDLLVIKDRDKLKNDFCKKKNIKLLRIRIKNIKDDKVLYKKIRLFLK